MSNSYPISLFVFVSYKLYPASDFKNYVSVVLILLSRRFIKFKFSCLHRGALVPPSACNF